MLKITNDPRQGTAADHSSPACDREAGAGLNTHQAEGGFPEELRQKVEPSQSILHSADISKSGLASGRKPVWPAAWQAGVKGQQGSLLKAAPWECPMGGDRRGKENSP